MFHVQCEMYDISHKVRCNRYVCSRDVLLLRLLLLLLAACSCVVAASGRGKHI